MNRKLFDSDGEGNNIERKVLSFEGRRDGLP